MSLLLWIFQNEVRRMALQDIILSRTNFVPDIFYLKVTLQKECNINTVTEHEFMLWSKSQMNFIYIKKGFACGFG